MISEDGPCNNCKKLEKEIAVLISVNEEFKQQLKDNMEMYEQLENKTGELVKKGAELEQLIAHAVAKGHRDRTLAAAFSFVFWGIVLILIYVFG